MKLLFVAGAAIPALVSLTVIVASQYVPTDGSEPQEPGTSVVAEGDAETGTCVEGAEGEDCEAYLAGRDEDLSPLDAPLESNVEPGDLLDQLKQQTAGFETPGFQDGLTPDLLCSSPLACLDGLPLPTMTMAWAGSNGVDSVDGGQTGEPLELVGHGTRDGEYGGSPDASGPNAGGGGVGATGGGSGAGGFLAASNDQAPAVFGPETPSGVTGSSTAGAFLNASNGGGSGPSPGDSGSGSGPESDPDPTVKYFVEEFLLGDDTQDETGDGPNEGPAILALGSGGQPPSENEGEPEGGQPTGPAFGDVLDQFPGGEEEDDYDDLAGGSDDGRTPDLNPSEVPEPANIVMVGTGLLIAAGHLRRRRRT